MRKIPTVFVRDFDGDPRYVLDKVTPGCEWALAGEGRATRKYDGVCVLIRRDGVAVHAFARREVKAGKPELAGWWEVAIDETTGKRVGWEPAGQSSFAKLIGEAVTGTEVPGTYELIGPKVNGNPERAESHRLVPHAEAECVAVDYPATFGSLRAVMVGMRAAGVEGVVWHHPDGRMAKLKVRDFPVQVDMAVEG